MSFYVQPLLKIVVGVDLCKIETLSEITVLEVISEIGLDMNKWKDSSRIAAWLNLAPNTKITGGKIISSKMEKKKNRAGIALRMAASNMTKSKSPMGDYARKMRSRVGARGAVVATAHKIARIMYTMIKNQEEYRPEVIVNNQEKMRQQRIRYYEKQLEQLKKAS